MAFDYSSVPSPAYVLHEDRLERNLKILQRVRREADVKVIVAFKGFAMWSAFPMLREYLDGATASSLNEAKLCSEEMHTKAHTYAVAYTDQSFEEICSLSSHLSFNSLSQFEHFRNALPTKIANGLSVGLRVNPEYSEIETELYNPAAPDSRLGIGSGQLPEQLPEEIEGLHFHVLCENNSYTLEKVLDAFEEKFSKYFKQIKWVNFGGGHLITQKGYDVEHLIDLLQKFKSKHKLEIIIEPGSAIAWETGDLVASVVDLVENGGVKTAIADISFTCHMPDCLEMPYQPKIVGASNSVGPSELRYRIGGMSCLAGDYVGDYGFKEALSIGDSLVFHDMIHYTMVKTNMFNGVPHPDIVIVRKSGAVETVRSFSYHDYKSRLS